MKRLDELERRIAELEKYLVRDVVAGPPQDNVKRAIAEMIDRALERTVPMISVAHPNYGSGTGDLSDPQMGELA